MMLSEIRSFAKKRVSFAFETTLSGRGYMALLRQLKAQGYEITFSSCGSHRWTLRYRECRSEFREAGTMCQKQWFGADLTAR